MILYQRHGHTNQKNEKNKDNEYSHAYFKDWAETEMIRLHNPAIHEWKLNLAQHI